MLFPRPLSAMSGHLRLLAQSVEHDWVAAFQWRRFYCSAAAFPIQNGLRVQGLGGSNGGLAGPIAKLCNPPAAIAATLCSGT